MLCQGISKFVSTAYLAAYVLTSRIIEGENLSCDGQRRDAEDFKEKTVEIKTGIAGHKMSERSGYLQITTLKAAELEAACCLSTNHP